MHAPSMSAESSTYQLGTVYERDALEAHQLGRGTHWRCQGYCNCQNWHLGIIYKYRLEEKNHLILNDQSRFKSPKRAGSCMSRARRAHARHIGSKFSGS